jgi:HD superfamily phosphohydrolase YqeK
MYQHCPSGALYDQIVTPGEDAMAFEIFVSYRSGDRAIAEGLASCLQDSWGYNDRIWRDEDRLQAGSLWSNGLDVALDRAELVIAVISKSWLRPANLKRLLSDEDYVRRELADTLTAGKRVLPVVLDELAIPGASQLPSELRSMLDVEWVRLSSDLKSRDRRTIIGALSRAGQPPTGTAEPWIYDRSELAPVELLTALQVHLTTWVTQGGCRIRALLGAGGTGRTALLERLRADPPSGCLAALHVVRDSEAAPVPYRTAVHWFRELIDGISGVSDRELRARASRALLDALRTSGADLLATNGLVDRSQLVQLARDLDDVGEQRWGARNEEFPPRRVRHQIISVIAEVSKVIPVLLLADDLHRLDDGSLDLLVDLQRALRDNADAGWQLALVVTSRPRAADNDADDCLADLPVDSQVHEPFGISTIGGEHEPAQALLGVVSRGGRVKLGADLQRWLCAQDYTPFLAVTALRRLNDDERLAVDADTGWQLAPVTDSGACEPERLDEHTLLTYLLETEVSDPVLPTLEAGAMLGLTFSFDLAVDVLGELRRGDCPDRDELWRELRSNDLDCMVYRCFSDPVRAISFAHGSFPANLVDRMRPGRLDALRDAIASVLRRRLDSGDRADLVEQLVDWTSLAVHLTEAKQLPEAAVAHMRAAELAARALADRQAIRHYEEAHHLFNEMLASPERGLAAPAQLLRMADCDVQKAQLLRISGGDGAPNVAQAEHHLDQVEHHLQAVGVELEDDAEPAAAIRDLLTGAQAEVDRSETYRRLVHAQRGEVALERGRQHQRHNHLEQAEVELLSALRHAEDSPPIPARRRLIDNASAELAGTLVMKTRMQRASWDEQTTHAVARDAMFHVARVIAFAPIQTQMGTVGRASPEPELSRIGIYHCDAVVTALTTQGRLHHTVHHDAMLASRCYRQAMRLVNSPSNALDQGTLLCKAMLELALADATLDAGTLRQAEESLADYRRCATEVGSERHLVLADLALAMAACVGDTSKPAPLYADREQVDAMVALTAGERRRLCLFAGLQCQLGNSGAAGESDHGRWFDEYPTVADGLRAALWEFADELPRCVATWTSSLFGGDDRGVVNWTNDFCKRLGASQVDYLEPDLDADQLVRRLAFAFLDEHGLEHARRVEALATKLVDFHAREDEAIQLRRDMSIAAHLHDWFRTLPTVRMLSLARDWHLPVNGVEWANPQLLHGPLAAELLGRQLQGRDLLGDVHFNRVRSMVKNHTVGCSDDEDTVAFSDAVFFLADCQAAHELTSPDHIQPDWTAQAFQPHGWRVALAVVREQKVRALHAAGVTLHPRSVAPSTAAAGIDSRDDLSAEQHARSD